MKLPLRCSTHLGAKIKTGLRGFFVIFPLALLCLVVSLPAQAAAPVDTWNNTTGDDTWATSTNWSLGAPPTSTTTAVFDTTGNTSPIIIDSTDTAEVIDFGSSSSSSNTLAFTLGTAPGSGTLTFPTAVSGESGSSLVQVGSIVYQGAGNTATETINANVVYSATSGSFYIGNFTTGGVLTINGNISHGYTTTNSDIYIKGTGNINLTGTVGGGTAGNTAFADLNDYMISGTLTLSGSVANLNPGDNIILGGATAATETGGNLMIDTSSLGTNTLLVATANSLGAFQFEGNIDVTNSGSVNNGTRNAGDNGGAPDFENVSGNNTVGTLTLGSAASGGYLNIESDTDTLTVGGIALPTGANTGTAVLYGNGNGIVTGNITGTNDSLIKDGSGTWTLSGTGNTYVNTTIDAGVLDITTNASLGTGSTTINGGVLEIATGSNLTNTVTFNGVSSSSNAVLDYNGASGYLLQNLTVTTGDYGTVVNSGGGVLNLNGTISKNGSVLTLSGGQFVVSGVISGSSNNSDLVLGTNTYPGMGGAATVGLSNANTYNGPTSINDGSTLLTGVTGALPTTSNEFTALTLGAATDPGGTNNTLDLLGTSQTVSALYSVGPDNNQVISSDGSASPPTIGGSASLVTGNLTVDYTTTNTVDNFSGSLGGSNGLNNFGLTKTGAGTLVLSGVNTYTGATTVNGGVLEVTGSTLSSAVGVGNGSANSGTLSGSGSVGDITLNAGGTVAPGSTPSINSTLATSANNVLTGTSLTINGGTLSYNLYSETPNTGTSDNPAGSTLIDLGSGALTFSDSLSSSNQLVFDFNNTGIGGNGTVVDNTLSGTPNVYDLIDFGSGLTEEDLTEDLSNGDIAIENLGGGQNYSGLLVVTTNEDGGYILQLDVVPEPATLPLTAVGLAILLVYYRRRRAAIRGN